jgi:hypothetical protein
MPRAKSKAKPTPKPAPKRPRAPKPPPPPRVTVPAAPPKVLADFEPPPDDELAAEAYLHRSLMASYYDAMQDKNLSPRERRKEMRTIAAAAAKAMPRRRLYEAEQLAKRVAEGLEVKEKQKRGAKLVPRPPRDADGPRAPQ